MSKKKRKSKRKLKASRAAEKTAKQITNQPPEPREPETPTTKQEEYLPLERELLVNVRTQWIFGDWPGLAGLARHRIEHHPDRAQLALYIAAGNAQLGRDAEARELAALAREWGCNRQFMAQVLISGTYNSLARSSALNGQHERFERHLATAMATGSPGLDLATAIRARRAEPMPQFGINGAVEVLETRSGSSPNGHMALSESPDVGVPTAPLMQIAVDFDGESLDLAFNPNVPDVFTIEANQLSYRLEGDAKAYLVSNASGNFEDPPSPPHFTLKPDTAYELSGHIECSGSQPPIVWLFGFSGGSMVLKQSVSTSKGEFRKIVHPRPEPVALALGIRLAAEGTLEPANSYIRIRSGMDVRVTEALQAESARFDQKLSDMQTAMVNRLQSHALNTVRQIEAFQRLQSYLGEDFLLPDMHGWPISPDLGVLLIRLIEAEPYDAVIELGSGVSTTIIAIALQKVAHSAGNPATPLVSFEHLEDYLGQTANMLEQAQLREHVALTIAPLVDYVGPDDNRYRYYDVGRALRQLREQLSSTAPRILILVDGPPADTGPKARYPALPLLLEAFPDTARLDFLMDDYIREDERAIVEEWEAYLAQQGRSFHRQVYPQMEKKACLLKVEARSS